MNRTEHLEWSKKRALEYLDEGDISKCFASLVSDLGKHDELKNHMGISIGMGMLRNGTLTECAQMRRFIKGFA
jgi:hypothetical protein